MDPPRIMGSEIEYVWLVKQNGVELRSFFSAGRGEDVLKSCLPEQILMVGGAGGGQSSGFLSNGGRLYLDVGFHPEYATPEGVLASHIVAYEKSGDRLVASIINRANMALADDGIFIRVFKNNIAYEIDTNNFCTGKMSTFGAHESYLAKRCEETGVKALLRTLGAFRATNMLFTGNGFVRRIDNRISYELSQRAPFIMVDAGGSTTNIRSLFSSVREEEVYASAKLYRRIHLISSDSNCAEVAIFLKFATMSVLLDMVEDGFLRYSPVEYSGGYVKLLHDFSADSTLRTTVTVGKKRYNIVDIQEMHYKETCKYLERVGADDERRLMLALWGLIIDYSRYPRPEEKLEPFCDWAVKKLWLGRDIDRRGFGWDSPADVRVKDGGEIEDKSEDEGGEYLGDKTLLGHMSKFDLLYPELGGHGIFERLNSRGRMMRLVSDDEMAVAMLHPFPKTTRACARATQIRAAKKRNAPFHTGVITWSNSVADGFPPNPDPHDWRPRLPSRVLETLESPEQDTPTDS